MAPDVAGFRWNFNHLMIKFQPYRERIFFCLYAGVALAMTLMPWAFLILSAKSPLHSSNASYINGFGLGVGFMFYLFVGLGLLAGLVGHVKRRKKR